MSLTIVLRTGLLLGLFALLGAELVAFSEQITREKIAANERQAFLNALTALVPPNLYDNDPAADTISAQSELLGTIKPVTVYRARQAGKPAAVIFTTIAPDGYAGAISLLIAIRADGVLLGVRVLSHRETPGLGDLIDSKRSTWILGFNQRSLINPETAGWRVKKDGGIFDQFTGATITPRAVVKAAHKSLQFYQQQGERLFAVNP